MSKLKKILFVLLFLFITKISAQHIDAIYLKDSTVIKGKIIEQKFQEYIKVESKGSTLTLNVSSIKKIMQEKNYKEKDFFLASFGGGIEYFVFGGKIQYFPVRNIGFSFGLGTIFLEVGFSFEINYHFYRTNTNISPKVIPTLGISTTRSLAYSEYFNGVKTGIEIGLKNKNFLSVGITHLFLLSNINGIYSEIELFYLPFPSIGYTFRL